MTGRGWNRLWQRATRNGAGQGGVANDATARHLEAAHDLPGAKPGTDWQWRPLSLSGAIQPAALDRPTAGAGFGRELTLWHDCPQSALILRQMDGLGGPDFALQFETQGFRGEYISVSMDLPGDVLTALGRHHILRLDAALGAMASIIVYARLNLVQGPNTLALLRQLGDPVTGHSALRLAEFDLGYADLSARAVDRAWLDLILQAPGQNIITLHDLVMSRYLRAQV